MIDDRELRALFKTESAEHLQRLEAGLLRLEQNASDRTTLEEVFREAHSLKGAARMLGVQGVERIAHLFEDMLGAAKRGHAVLSAATIDLLCAQLDAIAKLVHEAVTGEPAEVDVAGILMQLNALIEAAPQPQPGHPLPEDDAARITHDTPNPQGRPASARPLPPVMAGAMDQPTTPTVVPAAQGYQGSPPESAGAPYRLDTVRVDPQKLDVLMRLAGELTVAKIRLARRLVEIEDLMTLWEDWQKDMQAGRLWRHGLDRTVHHDGVPGPATYPARECTPLERLGTLLNHLRDAAYEDNARLDSVANELVDGIHAIRLLPLHTIFNLFPRMVRDLAREQSKDVQLFIDGGDITADKRIIEELKDPLMHLIRNAIDHGLEPSEERQRGAKPRTGTIHLRAHQTATSLVIEVTDDGRGLDLQAIRHTALKHRLWREEEIAAMTPAQLQSLIFTPGFSTSPLVTDVSGRGVGLDVVHTTVERLKGSLQVESSPGGGCTFHLRIPRSLTTTRVLLVAAQQHTYALPVEYVYMTRLVATPELFPMGGRQTIILDGRPLSVVWLSDVLGIRDRAQAATAKRPLPVDAEQPQPCIILAVGGERVGLFVDALGDEQEVLVKPHGALLKRVRNVAGATILGTGEVCIVLHPPDLLESVRKRAASGVLDPACPAPPQHQVILLVEDSITTRTQEKRILEGAGYDVVTAVDGLDALQKLSTRPFDAMVSDIQMPNMDGLTLTARIRQDKTYNELPIILVTSLATDEDKRRGVEVGANAYITKSTFDQKLLLETLRRFI